MPVKPRYPFFDHAETHRLRGLMLAAQHPVAGMGVGIHSSHHRGVAADFAEHRPYVPGDDLRHLDWKVYGRSDKRYVRQFEEDRDRCCWLVLDHSGSMQYRSPAASQSKLEFAQGVLAYLGWIALQQQDPTGVVSISDALHTFLSPSARPGRLNEILVQLQSCQAEGPTRLGRALELLAARLRRRGLVMVASDCFTDLELLARGLTRLGQAGHEVWVWQVVDPYELSFPFERSWRFHGLEQEATVRLNGHFMRAAYLEAFQEFRRRLQTICHRRRMRYCFHTSDKSPLDAIIARLTGTSDRFGSRP